MTGMWPVTERQRELLGAIAAYWAQYAYPPTFRDLMLMTGIKSASSVTYNLGRLEERDLIVRQRRTNRTLRLTEAGKAVLAA